MVAIADPVERIRDLRIAHLIETDGPGGAERVVSLLAGGFQRSGATNVAWLPDGREGWLSGELTECGVEVRRYRLDRPFSPRFARRLAGDLRERNVQIVHSHEFSMGFYGAVAARLVGVPHVLTMHGGRYWSERARRRWALGGAARLSGAVVAVSDPLARELSTGLHLSQGRVQVIPNGVPDPGPLAPTLREGLRLPRDARLVVAVGNLYPVKGHEHLIRALALFPSTDPPVHLAIAGRGELRRSLEELAGSLGVRERCHFLGLRDDIPQLLASADAFAMPSLSEGLPMALLEAMLAGVPAVATRVGQITDVLEDGQCGVLVSPGDAGALAAALKRIFAEPEAAGARARRARERVSRVYSAERMLERYAALYLDLLERAGSRVHVLPMRSGERTVRGSLRPGAGVSPSAPGAGMRVLMVDPSGATYAVTHNLTSALAERGLDMHVFSGPHWARSVAGLKACRYHIRAEYCPRSQLNGYRADGGARVLWKGVRLVEHQTSMLRLLRSAERYDLVHVQWLPLPLIDLAWLRSLGRRVPLAFTVHNLLPHGSRDSAGAAALFRRIYRIPRLLFVHTTETERGLVDRFGIERDRIVRIHHGSMDHFLDQAAGTPPGASVGADAGPPRILFFGQIRHDKGLDVLIRAAGILKGREIPFRLVIAGKPRVEMRPMLGMLDDLGLRDVTDLQLGFVEEAEIPHLFEEAALVALPYREIDQSGVAVTACTFGRPLVASRCGGLAELVEEAGNGVLVPPEDPQALADALERLLSDPAQRARYEDNSRRFAKTALSWPGIAAATIEGYRRCVADRIPIVVPPPSPSRQPPAPFPLRRRRREPRRRSESPP